MRSGLRGPTSGELGNGGIRNEANGETDRLRAASQSGRVRYGQDLVYSVRQARSLAVGLRAIAGANEKCPAAGGATSLDIRSTVTDHPTFGKVEIEVTCGLEQHSWFWLAARADVCVVVRTHKDPVDSGVTNSEQLQEAVVNLGNDVGGSDTARDTTLIGHDEHSISRVV